jgi:hypothetical protein
MNSDKVKKAYLRKSVFFRVFASNVQIQVYAEDGGNVVFAVLVGYTGAGSGIYAEINVGVTSFGIVKGKIPKKRFSPNFREKAFRDVSVIEGYRLDFFRGLSFHGREVFYYSEVYEKILRDIPENVTEEPYGHVPEVVGVAHLAFLP